MKQFFSQRLQRHQKQMTRYLRYVFNDHFALISTFLVGGLGLYYSELLKTLPRPFPLGGIIVVAVWLLVLTLGRLATLTKPADLIFLLAKEGQMRSYLSQALRYSLWLPFGVLFLAVGATMPLVVVTANSTFASFPFFLGMMWLLKLGDLSLQRIRLYQETQQQVKQQRGIWFASALAATLASIYVAPWLGLVISILQAIWFLFGVKSNRQLLDWDYMIQAEQSRLLRIYRFINLFTDVPQITTEAKRRKYLDWLLAKIKPAQSNTYLYLYLRRVIRGGQYGGLYVRLSLIGGFVLFFVDELWISLLIGCLFLYLIGFQLIPLINEFQYMVLTHLYPVPEKQKAAAIKKIIGSLLLVTTVFFGVICCLRLPVVWQGGIAFVGFFLFAGLFLGIYLPGRLKKMHA